MRCLVGLALLGAWGASQVVAIGDARADGAFPEGESVLLPRDRPQQIILSATFGLVFSDDDGASWSYACESANTVNGRLYSIGPPPDDRIFAVANNGAAVSSDQACSWSLGGGLLAGGEVYDIFPDPVDPMRVLATGAQVSADDVTIAVYASADGGITYDRRLFMPPPFTTLTGVEISASSPNIVYVTFYERPGVHPRLARSTDGGESWTTLNIEGSLGQVVPSLAGVDPEAPDKVYLRLVGPDSAPVPFESLAVTTDGGATWSTPVTVERGRLTAFLRRRNETGTVLVSALTSASIGFRSDDGGATFADWPLAVHIRGLGERDGLLYAATNDVVDGFAVAVSQDNGATWIPRLRLRDIASVRACVRPTCQQDCDYYAGLKLFPPETCNPAPDGGAGGSGGGGGGGGCCAVGGGGPAGSGGATEAAVSVVSALSLLALAAGRAPRLQRRRRW